LSELTSQMIRIKRSREKSAGYKTVYHRGARGGPEEGGPVGRTRGKGGGGGKEAVRRPETSKRGQGEETRATGQKEALSNARSEHCIRGLNPTTNNSEDDGT